MKHRIELRKHGWSKRMPENCFPTRKQFHHDELGTMQITTPAKTQPAPLRAVQRAAQPAVQI